MEKNNGKIKDTRQEVIDRWSKLGISPEWRNFYDDWNDNINADTWNKAKQTIGLDLVKVKPSENPVIDDINGYFGSYDPYWDAHQEPKGQKISEIDPYGEENWDDEGTSIRDCNEGLLPLSMKVAAKTIGLDLVAVKPMSAPVGHLAYLDFKYNNNEPEEPRGQIISDLDPYGEEIWED
jgi:hypothetical protein